MFEKLMNQSNGVSAEEVEKFREIYEECNEEETAAVLLLNKENVPSNSRENVT